MERYLGVEQVGAGSFGSVYRARDVQTGELVALKVFHNAGKEVTRSALREARFLAECSHCNIVALHEAFQSSSGRVYMVLEWAQHVLSQQLKSRKAGLPLVAVRSIIFQLLQALHYLHSRGIMHRDVKPANVLINVDGMVKLCDFGFARHVPGAAAPGAADEPLTSYVITRWYRAPEVVLGLPYGPAVDVWAVGCVLAEMLTGHPLFPGTTALDQLYMQHAGVGGLAAEQAAIMRGHPDYAKVRADFHARHLQRATAAPAGRRGGGPAAIETVFERLAPHMSRTMMHFFKMCLHPDPARRATAAQLLDTPFIREGAWQQQAAAGPSAGPHHHHSRPHTTSHALDGGRQAPLGAAAAPPLAQRSDHCSQQAPRGGGSRPGPTVLHRRAADVCKLLDSDQDDEETLGRLAAALPGGVPLSDSDSEADDAGARAGGEEPPPRRHALPVSSSLLRAQGSRLHTTFVGGDAFAAPGAERSSSGHAQRASARAHAVVAGGAAELDDRLSHRHGRATHMPSSASAPHCAVSVATAAVCRPPPAATTISAPGLASGGVEQGSFRTPPQAPCAPEASDAPGGGWHQSCAPEARPPPQQPPIQQGACGTSGRTYLPLASSSAALLPSRPSVKPPTPGAAPPVRSSFGDAPAPAAAAAPSLPSVLAPAPPSAGVVAAAAIMQATGMLEAAPRADWAEHCGPRSVGHLPEGRLGGEGGLQPPPQCPPPPGGTPHVTRGGPPGALVADPAAEGAPPTPPGPSKEEQAGHARVVVVVPGVGVPRAAQYLGQWSMQVSGRLQKLAPPHGAALPTAGPAVGPVTGDAQPAVDLQRGG